MELFESVFTSKNWVVLIATAASSKVLVVEEVEVEVVLDSEEDEVDDKDVG